jgi:hypothetical protein
MGVLAHPAAVITEVEGVVVAIVPDRPVIEAGVIVIFDHGVEPLAPHNRVFAVVFGGHADLPRSRAVLSLLTRRRRDGGAGYGTRATDVPCAGPA